MSAQKRPRTSAEERALRNGEYSFGSGANITRVRMREGVGNDADDVYTIDDLKVQRLAHSGQVIAGVLISQRNNAAPSTSRREVFLFAFHRDGSNFDLVGAGFLGDFERTNLNVLGDGEVQAEGLDADGNIDRELVLNANFFRIGI